MLDETLADLPDLDHYLIEHESLGAHVKQLWGAFDGFGMATRYYTFEPGRTVLATEASRHRVLNAVELALMGSRWNVVPVTPYSLCDRGLTRRKVPALYVFLRHTGLQLRSANAGTA